MWKDSAPSIDSLYCNKHYGMFKHECGCYNRKIGGTMIGNSAHKRLLEMVNTRTLFEGDRVIITFPRRGDDVYTGVVTHDLPKLKKVSIRLDGGLRTMQAYWNGSLWAENVKLGEENVKVVGSICEPKIGR
jgi:hypothetical protein